LGDAAANHEAAFVDEPVSNRGTTNVTISKKVTCKEAVSTGVASTEETSKKATALEAASATSV
jgi:hypothetical protein